MVATLAKRWRLYGALRLAAHARLTGADLQRLVGHTTMRCMLNLRILEALTRF